MNGRPTTRVEIDPEAVAAIATRVERLAESTGTAAATATRAAGDLEEAWPEGDSQETVTVVAEAGATLEELAGRVAALAAALRKAADAGSAYLESDSPDPQPGSRPADEKLSERKQDDRSGGPEGADGTTEHRDVAAGVSTTHHVIEFVVRGGRPEHDRPARPDPRPPNPIPPPNRPARPDPLPPNWPARPDPPPPNRPARPNPPPPDRPVTPDRLPLAESDGTPDEATPPTLADVAPRPWWVASAANGVDLPVGRAGDEPAFLHLGDSLPHGLVVGRTGSGKTTLLHTLVHATCARYSPDEIELWLVDLKEGLEFARYAPSPDLPALPHLRVVAADADREGALAVLGHLRDEVQRRGLLFRAAPGGAVANFASYREAADAPLPRVLLVMDEFNLLISGGDAIAVQAWDRLKFLVREGRGFGVHLLLASQSLGGLGAGLERRLIIDQMALRVALSCSNDDSRLALGDEAAANLGGLGACLVNTGGGHGPHQAVTVAYADSGAQGQLRADIVAFTAERAR